MPPSAGWYFDSVKGDNLTPNPAFKRAPLVDLHKAEIVLPSERQIN